jgi:hypothetical protein
VSAPERAGIGDIPIDALGALGLMHLKYRLNEIIEQLKNPRSIQELNVLHISEVFHESCPRGIGSAR